MSYVAIRGGQQAIAGAAEVIERQRRAGDAPPIGVDVIADQLSGLTWKVVAEGGLYDPELAALAVKQMQGDTLEAAFSLRAHLSTKPRLATTPKLDTANMRVVRRISSAFKEIPGGQFLGASRDYSLRLLDFALLDESPEAFRQSMTSFVEGAQLCEVPDSFVKVLDSLRDEGLLNRVSPEQVAAHPRPFDITREALKFPACRSAVLAKLARSEAGSLLAMAYSNMRGYGDVHPTIAELRVGYLPIMLPHPLTGELCEAGEVLMTECEVVARYESSDNDEMPTFTLGYGACFGHNETKAICMAICDRALADGQLFGSEHPSQDQEFVLNHTDGVEAMGFAQHYKLPHYVTFQSDLDRLRTTQQKKHQAAANKEQEPSPTGSSQ